MDEIRLVPLPSHRKLTDDERELLDFFLSGLSDASALRAQAAGASVKAICSCGCASVILAVDDDAPRARLEGPEVLPSGTAEIRAQGQNEQGLDIDVTLHIVGDVRVGEGVLREIEIWPSLPMGRSVGCHKPPPVGALRFRR